MKVRFILQTLFIKGVIIGTTSLKIWAQDPQLETQDLNSLLQTELTESQDTLTGDVQELIELQTQEEVIEKLENMEAGMVETTLHLMERNTSGAVIAMQTEIIENAYKAASEKQKSRSASSNTNKALMDMLNKMLGKSPQKPGAEKGGRKDNQQPNTQKGDTSAKSSFSKKGSSPSIRNSRVIPSATAMPGQLLPREFQELVDEYNKASSVK